MDLLWMILLLFLVCTEAENLTEVKVELGQNIILNCSDKTISQMHWYMEIHSQLRGCIIRTFSASDTDPSYCSPSFKTKFSVQRNSLVIKNITAGDCRCYFCAKKQNDSIIYVDTFCLVSDVPTTPSTPPPPSTPSPPSTNNSQHQEQHIWTVWQYKVAMYSSVTLNVIFILVIIGLVSVLVCLKRNMKNCGRESVIYENVKFPATSKHEMVPPGRRGQTPASSPKQHGVKGGQKKV